jgi:hypothetical protein
MGMRPGGRLKRLACATNRADVNVSSIASRRERSSNARFATFEAFTNILSLSGELFDVGVVGDSDANFEGSAECVDVFE